MNISTCRSIVSSCNWLVAAFAVAASAGANAADSNTVSIYRTTVQELYGPKLQVQQYTGIEFPDSANHFWCYVQSEDEDIVWARFDIPRRDLQTLMDREKRLPAFAELRSAPDPPKSQDVPPRTHGWWSFSEGDTVPLAAAKDSADSDSSKEQWHSAVWAVELGPDAMRVLLLYRTSVTLDPNEKIRRHTRLDLPRSTQNLKCRVESDNRTAVWIRLDMDSSDLDGLRRQFERIPEFRTLRSIERAVALLTARGEGISWWRVSCPNAVVNDAVATTGDFFGGASQQETATSLVLAEHKDSTHMSVHIRLEQTRGLHPSESIWRLVHLDLPPSTQDIRYYSQSTLAGVAAWIRFDVSRPDLSVLLHSPELLPSFTELKQDREMIVLMQQHCREKSISWWDPERLSSPVCGVKRRGHTTAHVCYGKLTNDLVRVYIAYFNET